jgi:hypothetical protein
MLKAASESCSRTHAQKYNSSNCRDSRSSAAQVYASEALAARISIFDYPDTDRNKMRLTCVTQG